MQKALDLIEAGSLPHRHSHACVVVNEAGAAEVELSFFDYQRQAYIGERGLSPQPVFFAARQRTLADYVVAAEVTRFLRRDARFGVASREGRLGDVRCKARTYVEPKDGALPVEFAVSRQDRLQGERPEISTNASCSPPSAPGAVETKEGREIGPWGPWAASAQSEALQECTSLGPRAQVTAVQARIASKSPETANKFKDLFGAIFEDLFGNMISRPAWLRSSLQNGDHVQPAASEEVLGSDVAQNDIEAVRVLREAANMGDAEAINKTRCEV